MVGKYFQCYSVQMIGKWACKSKIKSRNFNSFSPGSYHDPPGIVKLLIPLTQPFFENIHDPVKTNFIKEN